MKPVSPTSQAYELSAPALHAARTLMRHFQLIPTAKCRIQPTLKNIGIMIDLCTATFRMQRALDYVCDEAPWRDKDEFIRNYERMRNAIRAIEVVKNSTERYEDQNAVPIWQKERVEAELTRGQVEEMRAVGARLAAARTVDEEQAILRESVLVGQGDR